METMQLDDRILAKANSMKISSIEVTDFERKIRNFNNVYILKSVWLGEPTKLILRSYYQLWEYQCLLEKHIKNTPDMKEVLPPLPVVEDTDHMNIIEQYLMSLVLLVRNGSSMSAMIKNLFLPWSSDELIKEEYLATSSRSPAKSDREVVGIKDWFKVAGNFSSDDPRLLNVYEGDLVQNLGSVLQGWCFCKREQELGKLPEAILIPCTLTPKQIEAELIRLQEIREIKSLPTSPINPITPSTPNQIFEPECDYVEMNAFVISQTVSPCIPPPFKPNPVNIIKLPHPPLPNKGFLKSSLPVSLTQSPASPTSPKQPTQAKPTHPDDLTLSSADRYVVNDLEKTLTDDGTVPTTKPVPKSKQALHKSRSKSLHFSNKKSPTEPLEKKVTPLGNTKTRVSKIDYYAKSTISTWEEVKRVSLPQDQNNNMTCIIHKDTFRPGCALCVRSQWMAAGSGSEEIYKCVESHQPSQPTQLSVNQGDLVKVISKNTNGWWDVSPIEDSTSGEIKSLPATKLAREPQNTSSVQTRFAITRRNTSLETLEHDYYDLTDGVKQKISADESTSSIPINLSSEPLPYLTPIINAQPPPCIPPRSSSSDKLLSENELSRAKTTAPKNLQTKPQPNHKAKTLSPKPTNPCLEASLKQISPLAVNSSNFFMSESSIYQPIKKDSDSGEKPCPLSLLNRLATLSSSDSAKKRTSTFVSYLSEENKENMTTVKPKMESSGSVGLKKTLSREEKTAWSSLGKQNGFFGSLSKERADELLKMNAIDGEYLIRASSTKEDSFVLCVYHGTSVHRYLIKFIDGKFVTGEPPMIFSDFSDVVSYYKVNALEVMADKGSIFLKQPLLMKRQIK